MHRPVPTKEIKTVIRNFPKGKQALDTEDCFSTKYLRNNIPYQLFVCLVDMSGVPTCTHAVSSER